MFIEQSISHWGFMVSLALFGAIFWEYSHIAPDFPPTAECKYTCCTLEVYFCTLPQCLSKEKVVINVYTLQMQTSLLLGIPPTYAYFSFSRLTFVSKRGHQENEHNLDLTLPPRNRGNQKVFSESPTNNTV